MTFLCVYFGFYPLPFVFEIGGSASPSNVSATNGKNTEQAIMTNEKRELTGPPHFGAAVVCGGVLWLVLARGVHESADEEDNGESLCGGGQDKALEMEGGVGSR